MKITNLFKTVSLMTLFAVSGASQALVITIFDGTTTVSVTDGGSGDLSGVAGKVIADGSLGGWSYSVTAESDSSSLFANLFETTIDTSSSGGGALTITVADTYTGLSIGPGIASSYYDAASVGKPASATAATTVAGDSLHFESWVNATLVLSDTITAIGGDSGASGVTVTPLLTIKQIAVITHVGAEKTSFDGNTHVNVPEPVSLALLGIGLIGLGLARKRAV